MSERAFVKPLCRRSQLSAILYQETLASDAKASGIVSEGD
jgi:hypothetical protein